MLVEALIKAIETAFATSANEIAIVAHEVAAAASANILDMLAAVLGSCCAAQLATTTIKGSGQRGVRRRITG